MPLEELEQAVKEQRLALLPVERLLGGERALHARARSPSSSGLELEYAAGDAARARPAGARRGRRGARRGGPRGGEDPGEACREAGFDDDEDPQETNRVLGRGIARYVEALRTLDRRVAARAGGGRARARAPVRGPGRRARCRSTRRGWSTCSRCTCARCCATRPSRCRSDASGRGDERDRQAIAFADLVGFTELGETVDVEELGDVAARPAAAGRRAGRAARAAGEGDRRRGDARLARAAASWSTRRSRLVERAEATEGFPPLRAGVAYGPAVNHWGDWFGSTVNLASRLTARARPSSVLVTEEVRDALGERRLHDLLGRPEAPEGLRRAREDVPRQARAGRVSAFTKSSSWRVVQHS